MINNHILKRIIALTLVLSILLLWTLLSFAGQAAVISRLTGKLTVRKADGTTRSLTTGSLVDEGDTLVTETRSYARIKFNDGSEMILKQDSRFIVEKFSYNQEQPKDDAAFFNLLKGGLRTVTGKVGKRGNQDNYQLQTPSAVVGIRGTIYNIHFCEESSCGNNPDGVYLLVDDGAVVISNSGSSKTALQVKANQYVYVKDQSTPPATLPAKPLIPFNPPPEIGVLSDIGSIAPPDETALVKALYQSFAEYYNTRNDSKLRSLISDDWESTGEGTTLADLEMNLRNSFKIFDQVSYDIQNLQISSMGAKKYSVSYDVLIKGQIYKNRISHEEKSSVNEEVTIDAGGKAKITKTLNGRFWYVK